MKTYVTFGGDHIHIINGVILDKDTVAVITGPDAMSNRDTAFELFGNKFSFETPENFFNLEEKMKWFPKGLVHI